MPTASASFCAQNISYPVRFLPEQSEAKLSKPFNEVDICGFVQRYFFSLDRVIKLTVIIIYTENLILSVFHSHDSHMIFEIGFTKVLFVTFV